MTTPNLPAIPDKPTLSKSEATKLNAKIKTACGRIDRDAEALSTLLEQAASGNIHVALDYKSWAAWWADNVRFDVTDRIERKSLAAIMSSKGMSQRAIGASLGVDQKTVSNDLRSTEENSSVDDAGARVISLDGRQRPKHPKRTPNSKRKPKPRPEPSFDISTPERLIGTLVETIDDQRMHPEYRESNDEYEEQLGDQLVWLISWAWPTLSQSQRESIHGLSVKV
jgi:hypothetical protein